MLQEREISLPA